MQLLRDWPLLIVSLALLAGIGLGSVFGRDLLLPLLLIGLIATATGVVFAARRSRWLMLSVIVTIGVVGASWVLVATALGAQPLEAEISIERRLATIVSSPEPVGKQLRAYVDLVHKSGKIRLRATWPDGTESFRYGDVALISGTALPPRASSDFNERGFLLAHRAVGTLTVTSIVGTGERAGSPLLQTLNDLGIWFNNRLTVLDYPERLVVAGVLLGQRAGFPESLEEAFRTTGTSHILVASGSNVIIIAGILTTWFGWLGVRGRALVISGVLVGFIVLTGADASVIRATIFFELILLAGLVGRRTHALTLVAVVALGMALGNPYVLAYDIGFQLSFAAVLGLLWFSGWLQSVLPLYLAPTFLAPTLSAQLVTLPVLIYHFGQVSVVAPVANVLVVPMVEAIMAGGALVIALPWFRLAVFAVNGMTSLMIEIVERLASLPYAAFELAHAQTLWAAASVGLIGLVWWFGLRRWQEPHEELHDSE